VTEPVGSDVVARALAAACRDPEVLAKLGGALGEAARAALADAGDRKLRVKWALTARTPVPAGLRGVHGSWLEAGLAALPTRARAAVAAGGGTSAADAWLARWATASVPPMPPVSAPQVTTVDSATRVDGASLARWLEAAGADQLAFALGAAGGGAIASAARVVGDRLHAAAARIASAPRAGALGSLRAAIARCRVALGDDALVCIGARAVAPYFDALARRRLVHRLPRARGLRVADELVAWAHATAGDVPRWEALVA
jgi:hypothetical protein